MSYICMDCHIPRDRPGRCQSCNDKALHLDAEWDRQREWDRDYDDYPGVDWWGD